jgi:hypothetical protein
MLTKFRVDPVLDGTDQDRTEIGTNHGIWRILETGAHHKINTKEHLTIFRIIRTQTPNKSIREEALRKLHGINQLGTFHLSMSVIQTQENQVNHK